MKTPLKSPPQKRNLAAKALRDPLFRPKVMADPKAYKRKPRTPPKPETEPDDEIN